MIILQNTHILDTIIDCDCGGEYLHFFLDRNDTGEIYLGIKYLTCNGRKGDYFEVSDLKDFRVFINHISLTSNSNYPFGSLELITPLCEYNCMVSGWVEGGKTYNISIFKCNKNGKLKKVKAEILIDKSYIEDLLEDFKSWEEYLA